MVSKQIECADYQSLRTEATPAKLVDYFRVSQSTPGDLIKSGEVKVTGDTAEAARLLDLFDRYKLEHALVVPPALYGNAM